MGFENDTPNFTLMDDKAFTEDNVLIYNVFVFNIPHKSTDDELRRYFEGFGELSRVCIRRGVHSRKHAPRVGFVNFKKYGDAAKVLHLPFHYLNGRRIGVKACDSWHQPGVDNIQYHEKDRQALQKLNDRDDESISSFTAINSEEFSLDLQVAPIFRLNDDCLEMICQQLDLRDQLQFARTCVRFRNVFIMLAKINYKRLCLDNLELLTLWEIRDMLQMVGDFIEHLEGGIPRKESKRILEFLGLYCNRVLSLHLHATKFSPPTMKKLFNKMRSLTSLRLYDSCLNDHSVQHLRCLKSLKTLHLTENYEVTGRFLDSLDTLEELSLHGCGNIQPTYFIDICRKLKQLRTLDIQRCGRLNNQVFESMVEHCCNIEVLKMSGLTFGFECVAKLPKLIHLDLLAESLVGSPIFNLLVSTHSKRLQCLKLKTCDGIGYDDIAQISQLENLRIFACPNNSTINDHCLKKLTSLKNLEEINLKNCKSFTRDGLLWLLRSCKQLKRINIVQCTQLKEDLVHNIITILQKEEVPKVPSLIIAGRSGIPRHILEDETYKANLNRVIISIDVPFQNYEFSDDMDDIYDLFNESDFDDIDDDDIDDSEDDMFYMDHFMPDDSDDDPTIYLHNENDPYFDFFYGNGENFF